MAEKIVYMLGAGASAEALPLAKDSKDGERKGLASRMINLANELTDNKKGLNNNSIYFKIKNKIATDLINLATESNKFNTVDTLAKYYYLNKQTDLLNGLKKTLTEFFILEQLYNKKLDERYLVFLTSILEKREFPENIVILNWNYDFQMELAAKEFGKENFHLVKYFPPIGKIENNISQNKYSLIHLNGIAGAVVKNHNIIDNCFDYNVNDVDGLTYIHSLIINDPEQMLLKFAWEGNNNSVLTDGVKYAQDAVLTSNILVVIGYSFPFFNREVDREIFLRLNNYNSLKKIYYQDPVLDGQYLYNQFNLDRNIKIEHIPGVEQFYIPFEL
ncbi:MAG: hypothetical protein KA792_08365 [Bacteroidales bacterium]|nr:hypothetical protein [Bacteroidales bacterium]